MGHLQTYLQALPEAEGSYPEFVTKASAYRAYLDGLPTAAIAEALPPRLRSLITDPEPVTAWIPEVHHNAILLAGLDVAHSGEDAFLAHYERINEQLFSGPLYRMMLKVASPGIVLRGAAARWKSFHRGATFVTEHVGSGSATAKIGGPPHLYPPVLAEGFAVAFGVAIRLAGGKNASIEVVDLTDTTITLEATWS